MTDLAPVHRGDVVIADFVDARGREIRKRRPYVVVSPDDLNAVQWTYILAPLTTGHHPYRYRVPCQVSGRAGHVVLDQLRMIDAERVGKPVTKLKPAALQDVLAGLRDMFAD